MMNQRKVHSQGNVPFAWENQPGVSKVTHEDHPLEHGRYARKLPPPPCQLSSDSPKVSGKHDLYIPLPPCPFNPPPLSRNLSGKGSRGHSDPFLAAYKECTKSVPHKGKSSKNGRKSGNSREGRIGSIFSCKHSCGVREDGLIRMSQLSPALPRE